MSSIENWSSSFKQAIMYTTKQNFDEHYSPELVSWEGSMVSLNMHQSKARSIQIYHVRPSFKKFIAMKIAQDVADQEAERDSEARTMVEIIPTWLFEKKSNAYLKLNMMVEVRSLDPESKTDESDGDDDDSDLDDGDSEEDEKEEPELEEGIEDENSDDYETDVAE